MDSFDPKIKFSKTWRSYQARVLGELDQHLEDNHLHVVAAPGSGKTVLGLEVMLRLNKPTLILSPSLAIRDQWVDRLVGMFCPEGTKVDGWVSKDAMRPKFLTVSTYQGLHSAYTRGADIDTEDDDDERGRSVPGGRGGRQSGKALIAKLTKAGIGTIVVDEAHHLRSEWWKCLIDVKKSLAEPTVIALTATPPYDVGRVEWERYHDLCGPVDAEISVPELVWRKDLCPHQDCVYLSAPAESELRRIWDFRRRVAGACRYVLAHDDFARAIEEHQCICAPGDNVERILDNPEFYAAMAVFLNRVNKRAPRRLLNMLGLQRRRIPRLTLQWLEVLLTGCLYEHADDFVGYEELFESIRSDLAGIACVEHRKVTLRITAKIEKMLRSSLSKLDSIADIVTIESQSLGGDLRMVILTDFIRRADMPTRPGGEQALKRIGVAPIFEKIRRHGVDGIRLGILSGSLVVIPSQSRQMLENIAGRIGISSESMKFRTLGHDGGFIEVELTGRDRGQMVRLITRLFNEGGITVMVGTKALLGEGWDAPPINSLILASFVGSYMLSNQMRGRAIRTQHGNPGKTANIWHPVCAETHLPWPGQDMEMLARRFQAFVGVSVNEPVITNGVERVGLKVGPVGRRKLRALNEATVDRALDRGALLQGWDEAFAVAQDKQLIEEIAVDRAGMEKMLVFGKTIKAVLWAGMSVLSIGATWCLEVVRQSGPGNYRVAMVLAAIIAMLSAVVAAPLFLKAAYLVIRYGSVAGCVRSIGLATLKAMSMTDLLKSDITEMGVKVTQSKQGRVRCSLKGGTQYEKSVFLDAMQEILGPIDNPRYILARKSRLLGMLRTDYHAVPTVLGRRRESAEVFAAMWSRYVGPTRLIYARSEKGRPAFIKARGAAMSTTFQKRCDRAKIWQ